VETHSPLDPPRDCSSCPRLSAFREEWRSQEPGWYNAPVPTLGDLDAQLLIVGLAPGLRGANRTGRPFTGDFAGQLLYRTLINTGFATGTFEAKADDTLSLVDAAVSNAVRCVPPQNKPTPLEIRTCSRFLASTISAMPRLKAILALGKIAHDSTIAILKMRPSEARFVHAAEHPTPSGITLFDSYHCSRLNTNTGRLTEAMFIAVVEAIKMHVSKDT
jgi:uracil-DNA glycosylase family 4